MNKEKYQKHQNSNKLIMPLITAEELYHILEKPTVKVFDVRGTWGKNPRSLYQEYIDGHIPTALFLDWRKAFIEPDIAPNLAQVATQEEARQAFGELGIHKEDIVILYDDDHHMFAGRIWWAMRYWGFTNVQVLNGGFKYWQSKGFPTSKDIPKTTPGTFEPVCQPHLRIALKDFIVEKQQALVLDGRGIAGYNGKPDDPRTGHIPGAISTAYNTIVDKETGLFMEREVLKAFLDQRIPNWQTAKIISSCGAGYSGTVVMLALAQFGIEACLFDESFSVWKLDANRPVEQSY